MTFEKLAEAKTTLDGAEASETDELIIVVSSDQLYDMMQEPEITSSDYQTVKALVKGEIDTILGFKVVRVNASLLPKVSTERSCYAYAKNKMLLALGSDIKARITEREDKGYSTYAFTSMSIGAVRMQGEGVVKIECRES